MHSSRGSNRSKWVALLTVLAALAYALIQAAAPPDSAPARVSTALPSPSSFVVSGGLVPDTDASVPAASEALSHAALVPPPSEEASTF